MKYTDPDGEFAINAAAAAIGALSGALIGGVTTAIAGGSTRDVVAAALGGAASGALAGVTLGGSLVTQAVGSAALGAASAVVGDVVTNAVSGNEITASGVAKAALGGAVGGLVGFGSNKAMSAIGNKLQAINSVKNTTPNQIGKQGEAAVKDMYDIGAKSKISVNGRTRIPDGLTDDVLSEVKNTKKQSYTQQLRDFSDYADSNGLRMDLYTRTNTKLSKPLQDAIESGNINLRTIPE